jgi:hypothetical protein
VCVGGRRDGGRRRLRWAALTVVSMHRPAWGGSEVGQGARRRHSWAESRGIGRSARLCSTRGVARGGGGGGGGGGVVDLFWALWTLSLSPGLRVPCLRALETSAGVPNWCANQRSPGAISPSAISPFLARRIDRHPHSTMAIAMPRMPFGDPPSRRTVPVVVHVANQPALPLKRHQDPRVA